METKRQRVDQRNKQMKKMMEKQKIDAGRCATYGAGIAIETDTSQISTVIKEM